MKKLLLILTALAALTARADTYYVLTLTVTNNPSADNTLVIQGSTRTFKATVASPSVQVLIGATSGATTTNLATQLAAYFPTGLAAINQTATNVLRITSLPETLITASMAGTWGTLAWATNSFDQFPLVLPLSLEVADLQPLLASALVDGIEDYATNWFGATTLALTNFMNLSQSQTVTGAKTFSGAVTLSSASSSITGGALNGPTLQLLKVDTEGHGIEFGGAHRLGVDGDGLPVLVEISGSGAANGAAASYDISAYPERLFNASQGDQRYGSKTGNNTWTGVNTFSNATNSTFGNATIVSGTAVLTSLRSALVTSTGPLVVSNTAPKIIMWETDAATDEDGWIWRAEGGFLTLYTTLSGSEDLEVISIERDANTVASVTIATAPLTVGSLRADTVSVGPSSGFVGVGNLIPTAPASLSTGIIYSNAVTTASGDPLNGAAVWAFGGQLRYRTSETNEGAGANNRQHNRGAEVVGSGTSYTLANSYARVDFGGQDPEISLPTEGTYLVTALVAYQESGAGGNDEVSVKLYNSTAAADIANTVATVSNVAASKLGQLTTQTVVTLATASTLQLYAVNATGARGTIDSTRTKLTWVRLY